MKKTISLVLALLVALGCVFAFASCQKKDTAETTTAAADGTTGANDETTDANATNDSSATETETQAENTIDPNGDLQYILDKGTLVVGVTPYPPMDYLEDGKWVGFDAEYAEAVGAKLGVTVEFIEIDWDQKVFELDAKKIDVVWNGMTITDELKKSMSITAPYAENAQVVVVPKADAAEYTAIEDMVDLTFAVEEGSAGANVAADKALNVINLGTQADALLEVSTGKADACIIDLTMANAVLAEGSSYSDLVNVLSLNEEEFGIGCRTGSDLCEKINAITAELIADGTLDALATKYDVAIIK